MKMTKARRKHASHAVPTARMTGMILAKLKDFDIEGLEHGYTMERAKACEIAEGHIKKALAALMRADGTGKASPSTH